MCIEHSTHPASIPAGAYVCDGPHFGCTGARGLGVRERQHVSGGCLLSPPAASCLCRCMLLHARQCNCFGMLSLQRGSTSTFGQHRGGALPPLMASRHCWHLLRVHACSMPVNTNCLQQELIAPSCCLAGKPQVLCTVVVLSCCSRAPCCSCCKILSVSGPQGGHSSIILELQAALAAMQASLGSYVELPGPL